ncbi:elongation factor P [Dehalobacterium formicoaceticum]|uniref:Elongation factor P n=1 Tax=Dehalobacterium formicoaceticum TaxID=51515 RepID=A0ABT1Y522_9FIRM|nr:elongation factor P [Dehalobacterium formicoaceticum]MCR6545967.1 elongation factor P [Dehalobacterium formicoaceticum]
MISTNDFRTGVTIQLDGDAYQVVDFQHVKPGKGSAFVRSKLRNVRTGATIEKTFNAGEKLPKAHLERKEMQYLYHDGTAFVMMDVNNFEQMSLNDDQIGDGKKYLKENMNIHILLFQNQVIGVDLPSQVDLEVTETEPGIKGDTASGGSKPATVETGAVVRVPFFINVGDLITINTKTGDYIGRA